MNMQQQTNREIPGLPDLEVEKHGQDRAYVLVEIEGGLVQGVSLMNQTKHPILVVVRDYDAYNHDPFDYVDADWLLG